jgi:DNA-binding LytR/AlgR family response regulator
VTRILILLALILLTLVGPAAAEREAPIATRGLWQCPSFALGAACRPVRLEALRLSGPETILVRPVRVDAKLMPLSRPLMVWVVALASSEIRWNGVRIGRNGIPGPDAARERPGRFVAAFVVPGRLVRPGVNVLSARLSSHHLWLPVRRPVHVFDVGLYESPRLPGLASYLPALLTLGALAAAAIYFGAAAAFDRRDRAMLLPALIATLAVLQLLAETARTFVAYSYPWHLARVGGIALLAAATATAVAAYAAHRFAPSWRRRALVLTGLGALLIVLLVPGYDIKAMGAILAGLVGLLACAVKGARARIPGARVAAAAALGVAGLMAWQLTLFLDQAYFLATASLCVALVAEQVTVLRQTRRGRDAGEQRAAVLEERLRRVDSASGAVTVSLKDGSRTHLVPEGDILFCKAADDYSEVRLKSGRTLLATATLARLQGALPERFVRVHKSYIVNQAHVATLAPRPGGGRMLVLTDGSSVPVGRSYGSALAEWAAVPPFR